MKNITEGVRAAVLALYSALNAGDTDTFAQYMSPTGYTEYGENGGPLFTIDEEYVRNAFASGLKADFEIQELEVNVYKEVAVVTGYRFGRFLIPNEPTQKSRLRLSMVWSCEDSKWKLKHVHLSPSNLYNGLLTVEMLLNSAPTQKR